MVKQLKGSKGSGWTSLCSLLFGKGKIKDLKEKVYQVVKLISIEINHLSKGSQGSLKLPFNFESRMQQNQLVIYGYPPITFYYIYNPLPFRGRGYIYKIS